MNCWNFEIIPMAQFDSAIEKGIEKFNESSGFGNVFFNHR